MKFIAGRQVNLIDSKPIQKSDLTELLREKINWGSNVGVWCTCGDVCRAVGIEPDFYNTRAVGKAIRVIYPDVKRKNSNGRKLFLIPGELIEAEQ